MRFAGGGSRLAAPLRRSSMKARQPSLRHHSHPLSEVELEDGRRLALGAPVGAGNGSAVFHAFLVSPSGIRRRVAAKVFGPMATDDAERVSAGIANAAQRGALVHHPNVVETYDYLFEGQPILLLELVQGVNLGTLVDRFQERRRRLPLDLAIFIAVEAAEGLSGARGARDENGLQLGLLHRALTTREILLSWRGEVKVEGFGLDVACAGTSSVRSLNALAGRASMMAPEVACGVAGDARADVFSLGVLLRELLVGPRFPQHLANAEAIRLAREGYVEPIPFSPNLPAELAQLMNRALSLAPDDRQPNASAFVIELRKIALAMGVGDCRYFLRRSLDRELREGLEEDTGEVLLAASDDE
jgi:serine/threonine-protein kinase